MYVLCSFKQSGSSFFNNSLICNERADVIKQELGHSLFSFCTLFILRRTITYISGLAITNRHTDKIIIE